ncbi:Uncharacterized protein BM_BM17208 [Brugia malayi]|uniref:Uncharacterized protein n=1 Tax=Brugia malayi TaxID=6279 RepID=A0A4E9FSQ7_BRUMA|nr:Uncharacterized protein BM_BM17208 [Brugia malayi]VIP00346.1 Uncharacterized protein BM_BM17208 [Brugia malayi]
MSNKDLLLRVEHVKYRMTGASKSPISTFYVYEDRVEWLDNASIEKLVVLFSDIRELTATDLVTYKQSMILLHFWMCFPPTNPDMDEKFPAEKC